MRICQRIVAKLFTSGYFGGILDADERQVEILGIGANVLKIAQKEDISLKELSRRAGIPYTTVYNMVKRDSDRVSPENVQKLADALEVGIGELYGLELIDKIAQKASPEMKKQIHNIGQIVAQDTTVQGQREELDAAFGELNSAGREEAIKRINELKRLPEYSYSIQDEAERVAQFIAQVIDTALPKEKLEKQGELVFTKEQLAFIYEKILLGEWPLSEEQTYDHTGSMQNAAGDAPKDTDHKND